MHAAFIKHVTNKRTKRTMKEKHCYAITKQLTGQQSGWTKKKIKKQQIFEINCSTLHQTLCCVSSVLFCYFLCSRWIFVSLQVFIVSTENHSNIILQWINAILNRKYTGCPLTTLMCNYHITGTDMTGPSYNLFRFFLFRSMSMLYAFENISLLIYVAKTW